MYGVDIAITRLEGNSGLSGGRIANTSGIKANVAAKSLAAAYDFSSTLLAKRTHAELQVSFFT